MSSNQVAMSNEEVAEPSGEGAIQSSRPKKMLKVLCIILVVGVGFILLNICKHHILPFWGLHPVDRSWYFAVVDDSDPQTLMQKQTVDAYREFAGALQVGKLLPYYFMPVSSCGKVILTYLAFGLGARIVYCVFILFSGVLSVVIGARLYGIAIGAPPDKLFSGIAQIISDAFSTFLYPPEVSLTTQERSSLISFNRVDSEHDFDIPLETDITSEDMDNEEKGSLIPDESVLTQEEDLKRIKVHVVRKTLAFLVPIAFHQSAAVAVARYILLSFPVTGSSIKTRSSRVIRLLLADTIDERHFGSYCSTLLRIIHAYFTGCDGDVCESGQHITHDLMAQAANMVWNLF